ncbi:MAG: HAMP domain-containing sensor histidine kinase [Thermodesulfovibrionia bacterium]
MRTKLFFAFIFIVFLAFFSNIVFKRLIIGDFDDFIKGTEEDHIYWVLASVEGSFKDNKYDKTVLGESLHWGLMLGFETYVEDISGKRILSSTDVFSLMNTNMVKRMSSFLKLPSGTGEFMWYPLYIEGKEVGKLYIRTIERLGLIPLKEEIFRKRGKEFLVISFLIAVGGALFLAVLFTIFISAPVRRLTSAAEKIAKGDFNIQESKRNRFRFFKYKDEIDRLTETFNYMAEALRKEDEIRQHLTSNITHELRTPLTVIRGNLEAMEDGVITDTRAVIGNITSEIHRLISLVEGIEDVTRAEASFFKKGIQEEINLRDFIESIVNGMKKIAEEKGLFVKTAGPSIIVKTYPEKLHIIFKNLFTNACKFTAKGGITISWDRYRHDGITGFYISVEDTGIGIIKKELPKVFERFYKARDSEGRGLGLAIVKELAEVIGGNVEVESIPDQGSRFTLTF